MKKPLEVFYRKKCYLKICKSGKKTPVLEFLFSKVAGLKVCNFIKKDSNTKHRRFPVKFTRLRIPVLKKICEQLFLVNGSPSGTGIGISN